MTHVNLLRCYRTQNDNLLSYFTLIYYFCIRKQDNEYKEVKLEVSISIGNGRLKV